MKIKIILSVIVILIVIAYSIYLINKKPLVDTIPDTVVIDNKTDVSNIKSNAVVEITKDKVKIKNHGDVEKYHNSTITIEKDKSPATKPSAKHVVTRKPKVVINTGEEKITIKNWGFIFQPQIEAGINSDVKVIAGARFKYFFIMRYGAGAGINSSGFTLFDISRELPKLSNIDLSLGIMHTTFEVEKKLAVKAALSINVW